MLRATTLTWFGLDAKFWGFLVFGSSVVIMVFLPWLDRSPVKSWRYKGGLTKIAIYTFAPAFVILGYLGAIPASGEFLGFERKSVAQALTVVYFAFFILMPFYTKYESTKTEPERVTMK